MTMSVREYPPRLNVEITEEQEERLRRAIPHGLKKHIFQIVVDDLLEILEGDDSKAFLAMFLQRQIHLRDILKNG